MESEAKETLLRVEDYDESEKKRALNKKMIVISICGGVVIALIITVIGRKRLIIGCVP